MTSIQKIATGVAGLDVLLRGGIPEGRATLLAGARGTGKTVLALQVAAHLARTGCPTILVAVEESPEDVCVSGDLLGFDYTGLQHAGAIAIADATRFDGATIVSGEYDLQGLRHRLEALAGQVGARALVLDSASALFSPRPPPEDLQGNVFQLVAGFRSLGLTSIILADAHAFLDLTARGDDGFMCDLTILLRNDADGVHRQRSVEVCSYRRSPHVTGQYPCIIGRHGVTVFPLEADDAVVDSGATVASRSPGARVSTGIAGLDEMTRGGWFRDSLVVVRGPSGSGKTLLAAQFAGAGAARGEQVAYYAFEESRPRLVGNTREMGVDLLPFIESGRMRVSCRYAEATSQEDLLADVLLDLEARKPSLLLFDGMSSIARSWSRRTVRQFTAVLAAIVRESRCTALLTYDQDAGDVAATVIAADVSPLADAILSIDVSIASDGVTRLVRLVKSRGSAHAVGPYRLSIERGGPTIRPTASAANAR